MTALKQLKEWFSNNQQSNDEHFSIVGDGTIHVNERVWQSEIVKKNLESTEKIKLKK